MLTADSRSIRLAVALRFGIYNLIRRHKTLGTAPVIEGGEWTLEAGDGKLILCDLVLAVTKRGRR
jgi:hypothetical protein